MKNQDFSIVKFVPAAQIRRLWKGMIVFMFDISFYRGKRVLVTGHTGFKGAWLCAMLKEAGADVTGYALKPPTDPSLFMLSHMDERVRSTIGDIRDYDSLRAIFHEVRPEIVFHLAAQPIVRDSYKEPRYTFETNVMGTVNILECIRECECVKSFLNITTDKVYYNDERKVGFTEDMMLDGFDPYSNSKSCSELVTHSYKNSFFEGGRTAVSTARAGNVIGGGDFAVDRIIPDCIRAASRGKKIVVRNPHSIRPFQHVLEPLYVYLMIAEKQYEDIRFSGYYNVGPDDVDCVTTGTLTDIFCELWGEGQSWENQWDGGPHEAGFLKLNCDKLKRTFSWLPVWGIRTAVEKTVDWSKAVLSGEDAYEIMVKQMREYAQDAAKQK